MTEDPSSQAFFEAKYQRSADPWAFETSAYEQDRYATILRTLEGQRFSRAFEPGCSIGVLTERLACHCDQVEAIDISPTAVARARERCRHLGLVTVAQGALPGAVPDGTFDLIVLSEIGYYFDPAAFASLGSLLVNRLASQGVLLAAHWLGTSPDHRLSGDEVHDLLGAIPGLALTASQQHDVSGSIGGREHDRAALARQRAYSCA